MDPKLRILSLATALFMILLVSSSSIVSVGAHTFSPNESASFFSLVDQIKSVLLPIKEDVSSNITLAKEQAQYARTLLTENMTKELKERNQRISTELVHMLDSLQNISPKDVDANLSNLNDILAEAVTVRIEKDQLNNVTIQALAFANDINKILDNYISALNVNNSPMDVNNSNFMSMNLSMTNMSSMKMDQYDSMIMNNTVNSKEVVRNIAAYQRARTLIDIASNRFNTELKGKSNATSAMEQIVKGLEELKMSVQNKAPTSVVMNIVHGQIHPNLQTAFNLELAPATQHGNGNMSMSMSISNMSKNNHSTPNQMNMS